jgi:hypothetical protein
VSFQMVRPELKQQGTHKTESAVDNADRPATEVSAVPQPVKDVDPMVPLPAQKPTAKEKAKDYLSVTGSLIELVLKKVPEAIDGNPVKTVFSIAKSVLELKKVCCVIEF